MKWDRRKHGHMNSLFVYTVLIRSTHVNEISACNVEYVPSVRVTWIHSNK